ncbi:hypothetical protein VMCG_09913 [Cytospora schulzeri]|uniref:Amidase domain-containing protein n=1 Tax=Cytospora schulzeri TaxID=448051 RepID=A0A423VDX2_9PEZI|nr:hypothetical protein VMCG_09913 [Valsa malicola]
MATPGATLPHRAVSSIRGGAVPTTVSTSSSNNNPTGSGSGDNPRTPLRSMPNVPSAFNSPSALRAEDEILIIEFGARRLRVGFAGDAVPKGLVVFSPPQARRVGDFRAWDVGHVDDWRRNERDGWGWEYELWRNDVRAGVRSALVVDMGWGETVVTGVYEYREVQSSRSVRAGKLLVENTHKLLAAALGTPQDEDPEKEVKHIMSFEECEEIVNRLVWCKPAKGYKPAKPREEGLATVTEQDESEAAAASPASSGSASTTIRLKSTSRPVKLKMTYDQLSTPAENTFFDSQRRPCDFDDNELPLPLLIYRNLLSLPMDVRALCMSRIMFTGGCSNVLGLRGRILDEVSQLIQAHGWDPVHGKAVDAYKANPKLRRGSKQAGSEGPAGVGDGGGEQGGGGGHEEDGVWVDAPKQEREADPDPIEDQLKKGQDDRPMVQGQLRAIETLGAWSGASLLNLVKVPALATVEREVWREQGVNGASRPSEVDHKVAQRQSMADEIGKSLRNGTLTVVDLVKATTLRIKEDNERGLKLAAIISLAPEAKILELAEQLDRELADKKPRGPLHGIPVVIKLLTSGAIIIGKSNLSSPGGSSTGSAVSVSAGFAFIGIGTENDGSIVQPSSRQSLYSLKPTRGLVDCSGAFRASKTLDTPGAMARSARDVASATAALLNDSARSSLPNGNYESFFSASFTGLTVGFVDPTLWRFPPDLWVPSAEAKYQHDVMYYAAMRRMETLGAKVIYPVKLPAVKELNIGDDWAPGTVNCFESAATSEGFFSAYFESGASISNLADVVQYNKDHPQTCLPKDAPDQSTLIKAVEHPPSEESYAAALAHMRN